MHKNVADIITVDKIFEVIDHSGNVNAPGIDEILSEANKCGSLELYHKLLSFICIFGRLFNNPNNLWIPFFVVIHKKKGDLCDSGS